MRDVLVLVSEPAPCSELVITIVTQTREKRSMHLLASLLAMTRSTIVGVYLLAVADKSCTARTGPSPERKCCL